MPASVELVDLCQTQLELLRHTFGDVSSVVYLTLAVDQKSEPMLVPVAQLSESSDMNELLTSMVQRGALPASDISGEVISPETLSVPVAGTDPSHRKQNIEMERLVLPLIHQEIVMGVLVVLRSDRPWQPSEQQYLQTMSMSLAAGCFLDRQNQWLRQCLKTKQALQGEQSDVFHNLLHQFRNPLTAIGTFGKLMLRKLTQDDPNYSLADGIVRESQRLKELVTDFDAAVDMGKSETTQEAMFLPEGEAGIQKPLLPALGRSLTATPQFLGDVLHPLITVTVAAANERHRQFWHSPYEGFSQELVAVDAQAVQEVIANLLDNAFKYTPPNAWVWLVGGLRQENFLGVAVGDSGPGIPAADQARLFERHYRGIQSQGLISGTGLGLAIAKDLITQMGGTVDLISPLWAKGSVAPWLPEPLRQYLSPTDERGTVIIVWLPNAH